VACTVATLIVAAKVSQQYLPRIHTPRLVGLISLHPFVIWSAVEARLYALMLLISALQLMTLYEGFLGGSDRCPRDEELRRCRWRVAYLFLAVAGLYTHYYSGFLLAVAGGILVLQARWRSVLVYFLTMVGVALCFAPMTFVLAGQVASHTAGAEQLSLAGAARTVLWHVEAFLLPVSFTVTDSQQIVSAWVWRFLLLLVPILAVWKFRDTFFWKGSATAIGLFVGVAISLVGVVLLTGTEMFSLRHAVTLFIPATLATFAFVAAVGRGTIGSNRAIGWWSCAVLCFGINSLIHNYTLAAKGGDFSRVCRYLEQHAEEGQPVAVFLPCVALALEHHYSGDSPLIALPRPEECETYDIREWMLDSPQEIDRAISASSSDADVIWLVRSGVRVHLGVDVRWEVLDKWVADGFEIEETVHFHGSEVVRLRRI
jgi:hypothetical protein